MAINYYYSHNKINEITRKKDLCLLYPGRRSDVHTGAGRHCISGLPSADVYGGAVTSLLRFGALQKAVESDLLLQNIPSPNGRFAHFAHFSRHARNDFTLLFLY